MIFFRWLINALAIISATYLIVGVSVSSIYAALIAALVIGLLNALVRPLLVLLTLPITFLSLGLFIFVINAALVYFASTLVKGFEVAGFLPALWLGLYLWLISMATNWFFRSANNPVV
jgi:putative membrane protein